MDLTNIDTERRNPNTLEIDRQSTLGMLKLMNDEDARVAAAVRAELNNIAQAVDLVYECLRRGGRLVYLGSGTSGRLGVLDAVECPPTFGVDPGLVVGLMAGGAAAFVKAAEGAEDNARAGEEDLKSIGFGEQDALVGIAASGRTPYVLGGMAYAKGLGAVVIGLSCTRNARIAAHARVMIAPLPGPEVITGSTRLKSGTAQKMVLNMLSTAVMIKLGKVYGNLMVDVMATNEKLRQRAANILVQTCAVTQEQARAALVETGGSVKTAIVCLKCGLGRLRAEELLKRAEGHVAEALKLCGAEP